MIRGAAAESAGINQGTPAFNDYFLRPPIGQGNDLFSEGNGIRGIPIIWTNPIGSTVGQAQGIIYESRPTRADLRRIEGFVSDASTDYSTNEYRIRYEVFRYYF